MTPSRHALVLSLGLALASCGALTSDSRNEQDGAAGTEGGTTDTAPLREQANGASDALAPNSIDIFEPTAPATAPTRAAVLESPDDDAIGWLAVNWLGIDIPVESWAKERVDHRSQVDEFAQRAAVAREIAQIEKAKAGSAGIGKIVTTFDGSLSKYDTDYHEFYVSTFSPGHEVAYHPFRTISDNPLSHGVELRFRNGGDGSVWSVKPDAAQKVSDIIGYGRRVRLETQLRVVDVTATDRGAQILADILSYDIYGPDGRRLGEVDASAERGPGP